MKTLNTVNTSRVILALDDAKDRELFKLFIPNVDCTGYWEGIEEDSYIVSLADYELVKNAFAYDQECVLHIPADNRLKYEPCIMEYKDGTREQVGYLKEVSEQEAKASIGYTYVKNTNRYFIVA